MNKINLAVCDDVHIIQLEQLEDLIENTAKMLNIDFDIHIFDAPEKLYHAIVTDKKEFELFFLNINIDNPVGIEIGLTIRQELQNYDASFFYISPHLDLHLHLYERLYDLQPYYYLCTPVDKEDFTRKFYSAVNRLQNKNSLYAFHKNKKTIWLKQKDMVYIESKNRYLVINYFKEDKLVSDEYIGALKNEIDKFNPAIFIRPHFSFIVNLEYVVEYGSNYLKVINNKIIPISKNRTGQTKQCLNSFYKEKSNHYIQKNRSKMEVAVF